MISLICYNNLIKQNHLEGIFCNLTSCMRYQDIKTPCQTFRMINSGTIRTITFSQMHDRQIMRV